MRGLVKAMKAMVHMIGIGGIGMSGIAEILVRTGYNVSGSDLRINEEIERLRALGCKVGIGHEPGHLPLSTSTVVYSSAIPPNNSELLEAKKRGLIILSRAEMLGELMRKKRSIVVAGSHGKTTTTAMITTMMLKNGFDPTSVIGGRLKLISGNAKVGTDPWFVAESDESDGSFVMLSPTVAVVTNVDREHMNHYGSYQKLEQAFVNFCSRVPFDGEVIICHDDPGAKALRKLLERKKVTTYGCEDSGADIVAKNVQLKPGGSSYDLVAHGEPIAKVELSVPGLHNVYNSLAACAVGRYLELAPEKLIQGLGAYEGIGRRLELKGIHPTGFKVYDDYAHHPSEIKASLKALRLIAGRHQLRVVFQPHRYTRMGDLWSDFVASFGDATVVDVLPVYAAGEQPVPGIDQTNFVDALIKNGTQAHAIRGDQADILKIRAELKSGDVVVCMGAGDVTRLCEGFSP